jgi:putative SOS response-associated peptidase YedK
MPVILHPTAHALWLGETPAGPEALKGLLRPYPADRMEIWPVSTRVNSVKNDEPDLFAPAPT